MPGWLRPDQIATDWIWRSLERMPSISFSLLFRSLSAAFTVSITVFSSRMCLFPTRGIPQTGLHQIIGELGHWNPLGLCFVVKRADIEAGEGRGVVGSGYSPSRLKNQPP